MAISSLAFRSATLDDLEKVNAVIEAAIMTWELPDRVKRLSLPSYRYRAHDYEHLHLIVAEDPARVMIGVAAWEPAESRDAPEGLRAMLLHGLYVSPDRHREGVGRRLIEKAEKAAREQGFDGLLVKAQRSAEGFFNACGFERLPVEDALRDYPYCLWRAL